MSKVESLKDTLATHRHTFQSDIGSNISKQITEFNPSCMLLVLLKYLMCMRDGTSRGVSVGYFNRSLEHKSCEPLDLRSQFPLQHSNHSPSNCGIHSFPSSESPNLSGQSVMHLKGSSGVESAYDIVVVVCGGR